MDIIDDANERSEAYLKAAIARRVIEDIPAAHGACLNCEALLPDKSPQRWCDRDCRDDWFRRQPARAQRAVIGPPAPIEYEEDLNEEDEYE